MGSVIETSRDGRVLVIELTRPNQLNALNSEVLSLLREAVESEQRESSTGCVVIRGTGDKAFSAGADLDEIRGLGIVAAQEFINAGQRTMSAIAESRVPVIAEVDGFALGGGFELALACHLIVASERSQFGLPEARIGCMPGFGGTQRLPAVGGEAGGDAPLADGGADRRRACLADRTVVCPATVSGELVGRGRTTSRSHRIRQPDRYGQHPRRRPSVSRAGVTRPRGGPGGDVHRVA